MRTAWLWNSSVVLQLNYEEAQLQDGPRVRRPLVLAPLQLHNSALHCSSQLHMLWSSLPHSPVLVCSALLQGDNFRVTLSMFQNQPGKSSLQWKGKLLSLSWKGARGELTEVYAPGCWLTHTYANPHSLRTCALLIV